MRMAWLCFAGLAATGTSVGLFGTGVDSRTVHFDDNIELMVEIGFDPGSLAAAGCEAGDVTTLLDALAGERELRMQIESAKAQCLDAATLVSTLAEQTRLTPFQRERAEARAEARARLERAEAQLEDSRAAIRQALLVTIPQDRAHALRVCNESSERCVSNSFRVVVRTTETWLSVEEGLIAEKRAARLGSRMPDPLDRCLTGMRSEFECAQAQQKIASNLESIERVFVENR